MGNVTVTFVPFPQVLFNSMEPPIAPIILLAMFRIRARPFAPRWLL
jgi:hypothetical protein